MDRKLHNEDINNQSSSPNITTGSSEMRLMGRKCSTHESCEKVIESCSSSKTEGKGQLGRYKCGRTIILKMVVIKWNDTLNQIHLYCARNQGWFVFKTVINAVFMFHKTEGYFWLIHKFKVQGHRKRWTGLETAIT